MSLNPAVLWRCRWRPWPDRDNDALFRQFSALKSVNIFEQREVDNAIKSLEIFELKLSIWMNEHESFDIEEIDHILGIYRKHLNLLKTHEGVRFECARTSFRRCLRIIQFVLQAICDDVGYDPPAAINSLIPTIP